MTKKRLSLLPLLLFFCALVTSCDNVVTEEPYVSDFTILAHYALEATSPCSLVVTQQGLWLVDREYPGAIYLVSAEDGATISSYDTPGVKPTAIANDGENFWVADEDSDSIYKLNPDFSPAETYTAPAEDISALAFDSQGRLWSADRVTGCIYLHNPDLTVALTYPGTYNYDYYFGMSFDGENLWACDSFQGMVYVFDSQMERIHEYLAPWHNPTGVAVQGDTVWVLDVGLHSLIKCEKP